LGKKAFRTRNSKVAKRKRPFLPRRLRVVRATFSKNTLSKIIPALAPQNHKILTLCYGWVTLLRDGNIRNNRQPPISNRAIKHGKFSFLN
jgi:hypothetical protein